MNSLPALQSWPSSLKKLTFAFVFAAFLGVVVGGVMIEVTTRLTPRGVTEQYRGMDREQMSSAPEMKFPKSVNEMLITTHNHILGLSPLFLIVGALYLLSVPRGPLQVGIAVEPFVSLLLTFGGLWVVRYLWAPFVYVVILSGALMLGAFAWMSLAVMKACLSKNREV